jgi:succinate dehydrogenase/fumarate reductase flavoprotein subunit
LRALTTGLRVIDESCASGVAGLFVAGDAASREPVAGATSGGGAQNSAWALSSGNWAGRAAANFARRHPLAGQRSVGAGRAGVRPWRSGHSATSSEEVVAALQAEMHPLDKNFFRTGEGLRRSLARAESRGMHTREDRPCSDPAFAHRLVVSGLDEVRIRPEKALESA